jgi:hypothetical protein
VAPPHSWSAGDANDPAETGKVHQPLPINSEALDGRWRQLAVAPDKLRPQLLACRLALGRGHGTEERTRLGLLFFRDRIQDVGDPMVPAPLLGRGRLQFAERRPNAKVAVCNRTAPGWQPAVTEIAQDGSHRNPRQNFRYVYGWLSRPSWESTRMTWFSLLVAYLETLV